MKGLGIAARLAALACLLVFSLPATATARCPEAGAPFPAAYAGDQRITAAIEAEASQAPIPERLTGIVVPHHLVAADLIARGMRAASGSSYDRIMVLVPDHFQRSTAPIATTGRGFETAFGPVETDEAAATALIAAGAEDSCLFGGEHGLLALLPFLKHSFPNTPILPVAISIRSTRADWENIADLLAPLVDERTLVVLSADFSHYHPFEVARQFDQRTMHVLADGRLDAIAGLHQPDNLDTVGGLYIQTKLQRAIHGAAPVIIASKNQQAYGEKRLTETTGYLVIAYGPFAGKSTGHIAGGEIFYLAGDTQFGRAMAPALSDADAADRVTTAVLERTRGRPLVVNLEGVILSNVPEGLPHMTIAMPYDLTLGWLKRLNVTVASLANNHAMDLGADGLGETTAALEGAGIVWLGHGGRTRLGGLTLVALTDIDSNGPPYVNLIDDRLLDRLIEPDPGRPVVAFVHWGREYVPEPGARETSLAERMRLRGASIIVGAHPHVASDTLTALSGGEALLAFSIGNFLFDQSAGRASGALIELRVFAQGTIFARQVDLPNLFDLARGK